MSEHTNKSKGLNNKKTIIIALIILAASALVTFVIFITEPTAKRQGATKESAMLVNVLQVERENYQPLIKVTGTVTPSKEIILSSRVSGEIIQQSASFTPGGFVEKGELLLKIDPSDYRNTLQLRESELHQAQADLEIEMGRQDVAKQDYALIDEELTEDNKSLVLRKPQLNAVKARIQAAAAAVEQAKLDLQRTNIKAPFDALIVDRNVNTGSQVAPGESLGRLVGIDEYWIETTVPLSQVRWLNFPRTKSDKGSAARIINRTAWEKGLYRTGYLYQLTGTLESQTRLARVLVEVKDPLARNVDKDTIPRLMIGAFVEVNIMADTIQNVVRLNRDYVRKDETVWVMQHDSLKIKNVEIIFRDADHAYIGRGLNDGDFVVTTNLSTVVEGAALRIAESDSMAAKEVIQEKNGGSR